MRKKILLSLTIILIGILSRIWLYKILPSTPHIYITLAGARQPLFMMDVFFVIAGISLISGRYLGDLFTFVVPLSIMVITDILIGNTMIFLFTWSGFVFMAITGYITYKKSIFQFFGFGILSVIMYDLWTNFGCWIGWYEHTIEGLILCYTVAIPFMLWHLISTALILPLFSIPLEKVELSRNMHLSKYISTSPAIFLIIASILSVI
ncbi:MAG TPA: hypothetical protein ENI33_01800 [Thermoplasmatales archaeon]|nr:hypothetical protein [Thermoplasmatales archaeon]